MRRFPFTCWCPDDGDEDSAQTIEAENDYMAALKFGEDNWSTMDYPDEFEVRVRAQNGALVQYTVEAEQTVEFRAHQHHEAPGLTESGAGGK